MKACVPLGMNEQVAGKSDLTPPSPGGQPGNFASLLDLVGSVPGMTQSVDEKLGKHVDHLKEKDDSQWQPEVPRKSRSKEALVLSAQTATSIVIAPWQLESDRSWNAADAAKLTNSPPSIRSSSESAVAIHLRPSAENEQAVRWPAMLSWQSTAGSTLMPLLVQDSDEPSSIELSEGQPSGPDLAMDKTVPSPNDSRMQLVHASADLIDSSVLRESAASDSSTPASVALTESTPIVVRTSMACHAVPSHEMRTADGCDNPSGSPKDRAMEFSIQDAGHPELSVPTKAEQEITSSSTIAGDWNPNTATEIHRGAAHTTITDSTSSVPEKTGDDSPEVIGKNTSFQGHPTVSTSDHPEPAREPTPNAHLMERSSTREADLYVARLLSSPMRGDLRVGVQTEAFGHVTIQANVQSGQLSAQLSVENSKESALLAAHLPAAEHRLTEQHGVTASVRLAGGFGGNASGFTGGGQSGSNKKDSGPYVAMRPPQIEQGSSNQSRGNESTIMASRQFVTSRLDVTV